MNREVSLIELCQNPGVQLDFDEFDVALSAKQSVAKWKWLAKAVGEHLAPDGPVIRFVTESLKIAGEGLGSIDPDSIRSYVANRRPGRDPKRRAIQLAAGLFGSDYGKWLEVLRAPELAAGGGTRSPYKSPLRLAILRVEDIAYTQDIFVGFLGTLTAKFGAERIHIVADRVSATTGSGPPAIPHGDAEYVVTRATDMGADYVVAVGTQAASALKTALGKNFGVDKNFLFLGVTYPLRLELVSVLGDEGTPRKEDKNVCGVGYGSELNQIANWIVQQWPTSPVRFVYCLGTTQDEQAAEALRPFSNKHPGFRICGLSDYPDDAFFDAEKELRPVYFSWHTFEIMFENPQLRARLSGRRVVATTRRNVEYGYAAVGYSSDDFEIGRLGADIVVAHVGLKRTPFGRQNVAQPKFHCWVNDERCDQLRGEIDWVMPPELLGDPKTTHFGPARGT